MNKQDLIDVIALETESSKAAVGRMLESFMGHVQSAVSNGDPVKLTGFGTFERARVAARPGRNPKTGVPITIPATVRARFVPGAAFKAKLRG